MKEYRKTIQMRKKVQIYLAILTPVFIGVCGLIVHNYFTTVYPFYEWIQYSIAIVIGLEVSAIRKIRNYRSLLKDDQSIESAYINEKDERNQMIQFKSCMLCLKVQLLILSYGALLASFFSRVVFMSLGISMICLLALYFGAMMYYNHKL